jgi:hypothetical protein
LQFRYEPSGFRICTEAGTVSYHYDETNLALDLRFDP